MTESTIFRGQASRLSSSKSASNPLLVNGLHRTVAIGTAVAQFSGDMLRISEANEDGTADNTLRLEGHVTGPWVDELRRVCVAKLGVNGHHASLVLDLTGVAFLDADAVALFRDLARRDVVFVNASPFIAEQLRGVVDVQR
jgi:hypothetical protein